MHQVTKNMSFDKSSPNTRKTGQEKRNDGDGQCDDITTEHDLEETHL